MKPEPAKPIQPEAKQEPAKSAQPEAKPEDKPSASAEAKPAQSEAKPEAGKPAEDKKPESHAVSQFEFKKPTLVVNYPKFQNSSFTIGQYTLKAPEQHHLPEPPKPVPAKSFKAAEKLHLDVKITTAIEAGDGPVISLDFPAKTEQPAAAPVRRRTARKTAPKNFRPAKPLKLRVKVSPAAQDRTSAAQTKAVGPEKKKPRKTGAASAKKGK